MYGTPLSAAFIPLVPEAFIGGSGAFSQTSTPAVIIAPNTGSKCGGDAIRMSFVKTSFAHAFTPEPTVPPQSCVRACPGFAEVHQRSCDAAKSQFARWSKKV
jgi:hypothetical protein